MTWKANLPAVRGKLLFDEPLAPFTWFRVGGPAEVLFLPADPEDLADFLRQLPAGVPVTGSGRLRANELETVNWRLETVTMIRLRNIEKCYETRAGKNYVLRQINLEVEELKHFLGDRRIVPAALGEKCGPPRQRDEETLLEQ